jgi:hypothetical protein
MFLVVLEITGHVNLVEYGSSGFSVCAFWACSNYMILSMCPLALHFP